MGVLLCLIVGISARGVVSGVNNVLDFREVIFDGRLDPLFQGCLCHSTSLASATHVDVDSVALDFQ